MGVFQILMGYGMSNWYFREKAPNEAERNPIGAEFFSDEAIERPGQALVREAV